MEKYTEEKRYSRSDTEIEKIDKTKKQLFIQETNEELSYLESCPHDTIIKENMIIFPVEDLTLASNELFDISEDRIDNHKSEEDGNLVQAETALDNNKRMKSCDTKKRLRQPQNWQRNILKRKRESGEGYTNKKGKEILPKTVKPGCQVSCPYMCITKFSQVQREQIKNDFYKLNDAQKNKYYKEYTKRIDKQRTRTKNLNSRRKFSFEYFFPNAIDKIKVCKTFFCTILDISVRRIYYLHNKISKQKLYIVPTPDKGKHVKKATTQDKIREVIDHINSFPTKESHFCRASSKRKYLDQNLNMTKMYAMYTMSHKEPVKECIYRKIFNEKFNLSFHHPKKDACDACWEFRMIKNPNEEQTTQYEKHLKRKEEGNKERAIDRQIIDPNNKTAVVTFDLENIFSLPKANVSCFFYKSKLTVYNLTAHCNINKFIYNSIWDQTKSGRSGDDLASALVNILSEIVKDLPPHINKLILWSDSCVPQNRNSHMSMALIQFLLLTDTITEIEQKFSEPGHGNVQEVDAAHSIIERSLKYQDIYSPLSLMRAFVKIKSKNVHFKFFQLNENDFKSYHEEANKFGFYQIPYTKVKSIKYTKVNWNLIQYKTSFQGSATTVDIKEKKFTVLNDIMVKESNSTLTKKKIDDIRSMFKYMPEDDRAYMEALLKGIEKRPKNDIALDVPSTSTVSNQDLKTKGQGKKINSKKKIITPPQKNKNKAKNKK